MNLHGVAAIYNFEMGRARRTLMQSIVSPVLSTALYFVVFGSAIGSRIPNDETRQAMAESSALLQARRDQA